MICYMDITFCMEKTCAKFGDKNTDCQRSLTPAIEHLAAHWWNDGDEREDWSNPPFAVYTERPTCYEEISCTNSEKILEKQ